MEFPGIIQSKFPRVKDSIFSIMSAKAREFDAVNLSQGFPDFEVDADLIKLVNEKMKYGRNQYAPMAGTPELRTTISETIKKIYGAEYDPETEITITSGATQAIFTAITSLIKQNDEVIVFTPAYDCYAPAIEHVGGKPVYIKLKQPEYSIDWEKVKRSINIKTRMIIINTPHNPTGTILSANDMIELEKLIKDKDIIVLSDEVYEHIIFDGIAHMSAARFPSLAKQSLIVASFGKTFHATGWKIGYIAGPKALMTEFRKLHQYTVFAVNTPIQLALADYMKDESNYLGLGAFYQERRDYFLDLLKGSRFTLTPSTSTYFQLVKFDQIDSSMSDIEFANWLVKEKKVASIPISVFYHRPIPADHALRFCFAKGNETLEKSAKLLREI